MELIKDAGVFKSEKAVTLPFAGEEKKLYAQPFCIFFCVVHQDFHIAGSTGFGVYGDRSDEPGFQSFSV